LDEILLLLILTNSGVARGMNVLRFLTRYLVRSMENVGDTRRLKKFEKCLR